MTYLLHVFTLYCLQDSCTLKDKRGVGVESETYSG